MKNRCSKWLFVFAILTICAGSSIAAQEKLPSKTPQDVAREKLLKLLSGEWISRGLYVATKLEIADHLQAELKSIEELANLTGTHVDSLYRLLHMLAGFGIFEEVCPRVFSNTESSRLLAKSNPDSLHFLSLWYGEEIHKSWDDLLPSIQTGTPAFQLTFKQPVSNYFKENVDRAALFQDAMKEKTKAVAKSALSTYDFSKFQTVYDIGGGSGQFMQALLQKHPNISGMIFELPEVIEKIREQKPPIECKRCKLSAGDFFVAIPEGGDIYLLKSILHEWDDGKAEKILKNCHQAMRPNSRLLIVEVVLRPKNESLYPNCMDLLMMAFTGGRERSLASFKQMFENCGFVLERIYPTSTEFSILEVRKNRE